MSKAIQIAGKKPDNSPAVPNLTEDGDLKVVQSGTIVARSSLQTLIPRATRTATVNEQVTIPQEAKGFVFTGRLYGSTGTFTADQGMQVSAHFGTINVTRRIELSGDVWDTGSSRFQTLIMYPGAVKGDLTHSSMDDGNLRISGTPIPNFGNPSTTLFRIIITGTFEASQGVDCDAILEWLY